MRTIQTLLTQRQAELAAGECRQVAHALENAELVWQHQRCQLVDVASEASRDALVAGLAVGPAHDKCGGSGQFLVAPWMARRATGSCRRRAAITALSRRKCGVEVDSGLLERQPQRAVGGLLVVEVR